MQSRYTVRVPIEAPIEARIFKEGEPLEPFFVERQDKLFTWCHDPLTKRWYCEQTKDWVTDVMLADMTFEYGKPYWLARVDNDALRALMVVLRMNSRKMDILLCPHADAVDITEFGDSIRRISCRCGYTTPKRKEPTELEKTAKVIEDSERFLEELKESRKETERVLQSAEEIIREVFDGFSG